MLPMVAWQILCLHLHRKLCIRSTSKVAMDMLAEHISTAWLQSAIGHAVCYACAGTAFRKVLFEGWATQDFGNRVLQPNAVPHALALVILLALLLVRLFGAQALHLVSQAFALLGMGRSNKYKLTNLPSLAIAVRSRLLVGPGSYSMEKDEKYAEVFAVAPAESTLLKGNQDRNGPDKAPRKPSKINKVPD